MERKEKWELLIELLQAIHSELQLMTAVFNSKINSQVEYNGYVHLPFRGAEIYLLHKAFIDSGGCPNETYKTLMEKTLSHIANKTQRGFSVQSFTKYSDKVNYESKDTVKRFLQRMIRNIDSYD